MRTLLQTALISFLIVTSVAAQDVEVDLVIDGLKHPCGIAIQPGTGHVFVSDSGNLRVIRIVDGKIEEVITDFPKDVYGAGPRYDIGPLGLAFVDQNTLIVGGGGKPDGEDILRIYKVPEAGADAIKAEKMEGDAQTLKEDKEKNIVGEGNFYGVAIFGESVYTTCNGDDEKGWVASADIADGKLSNFERQIATKEKSQVDAPVAITKSPEGYIVVGQMGEISIPGDSLLTFYDTSEEELADWKYSTGLNDITALAYGPKRGRLFAADFNWLDSSKGGLFKIVAGDEAGKCKTVKLADLVRPTAMCFDDEGTLYIALAGSTSSDDEKPNGSIVKIEGLDAEPKKED